MIILRWGRSSYHQYAWLFTWSCNCPLQKVQKPCLALTHCTGRCDYTNPFARFSAGVGLKQTQLVHIPGNLYGSIQFPDFSSLFSSSAIWKDGLIIGLLATLETLLCVEAIDKLDQHNRITPVNRELVAQGIGNMLCGLLGAIPMTAVVVRERPMWDAGAEHGCLLSRMAFSFTGRLVDPIRTLTRFHTPRLP